MLRIIVICVAAAMICTLIRVQRPEIAMMVSLAAGMAAIIGLWGFCRDAEWIDVLNKMYSDNRDIYKSVFKAAGIGILAEFCMQICEDAGERALAGRIGLVSRLAMILICAPMMNELIATIGNELP